MANFEARNNPQEKNEYSRNFIKKLSPEEQTYVLKTLGVKDLKDPDLSKKVKVFQELHKKQLKADGLFGQGTWDRMKIHFAEKQDLNELKQTVENKGKKTLTYENGTVISWTGEYEDAWKDGKLYGKNITQIEPNGVKYEGTFREGKPNGQGKYTNLRGNVFEGIWINGKLPNGTVHIDGGGKYTGELGPNLILEGRGQSFDDAGKLVYNGEWEKGQKTGNGTFHYPDGRTYIGQFLKNEINGQGTMYDANGNVQSSGNWKKGVITKFI